VARLQHVLLDEDAVVAERALRLALARGERCGEILALVDAAHALAAAARACLDQHRKADLAGLAREQRRVLIVAVIAGREWNAGLGHQRLGRRLRAHGADRRRRRADEDDSFRGALLGELVVLGQKAVARMDRLRPVAWAAAMMFAPTRYDSRAGAGPMRTGLVGHSHVARVRIGV
jgi:hypothetical protein